MPPRTTDFARAVMKALLQQFQVYFGELHLEKLCLKGSEYTRVLLYKCDTFEGHVKGSPRL